MKIDSEAQAETTAAGTAPDRCYSKYNQGQLDFCPLKDLNLPANYEEVLDRFNRLQGDRAMEALN